MSFIKIEAKYYITIRKFFSESSLSNRIYRRYLRSNRLLRPTTLLMAIGFAKAYLAIDSVIGVIYNKGRYRIMSALDWSQKAGVARNILIDKSLESGASWTVSSLLNGIQKSFHSTDNFVFPEIYVVKIVDAAILPGSQFIFLKKHVIIHDLVDLRSELISEEMRADVLIDRGFIKECDGLIKQITRNKHVELDRAAMFVHPIGKNYAHFISEILTKISIFCEVEEYKDVALLIDAELHPNQIEAIRLVVGEKREIVLVKSPACYSVSSLYFLSSCGYAPLELRKPSIMPRCEGLFSGPAVSALREAVIRKIESKSARFSPKKIYISRRSSYRNLTNCDEIESIFAESGFSVIDPLNLSFVEQVRLFSAADSVAGPSGAALANCLFCKPGTTVTIIIAENQATSYSYWPRLLSSSDIKVDYLLGVNISGTESVHSDFWLDPMLARCALASMPGEVHSYRYDDNSMTFE